MKLHRGRLIDHVHLMVADIAESKRFYKAVLEALGIAVGGEGDDHLWADELYISTPEHTGGDMLTGRHHLAFQAADRETVERFHAAAVRAGGTDFGKPGERARYHPGYYAAFVLDPDGNNIEAVFHGPANKSAESVEITFARPE